MFLLKVVNTACMGLRSILLFLGSDQCDDGEVMLRGGSSSNEGRVEICTCRPSCSWDTILIIGIIMMLELFADINRHALLRQRWRRDDMRMRSTSIKAVNNL